MLRTDPSEEHTNPHLAARAKAIREQLSNLTRPCCETPMPSVCDMLANGEAKIARGPHGTWDVVPADDKGKHHV